MPSPKHFHNFKICRYCGAEYDDGYPGSDKASDGEHLCDAWILEQRLGEVLFATHQERDEITAHLQALTSK